MISKELALYASTAAARQVGKWRGRLERGGPGGGLVYVMGLLSAVVGIGQGARLFRNALNAGGLGTRDWDVSSLFAAGGAAMGGALETSLGHACVISHLNPVEHIHALALWTGPRPARGQRIGYWAWETTRAPKAWRVGLPAVDEIWCPSTFTAQALRDTVKNSRPVRVIPHPLAPMASRAPDRERFGINPGVVAILTVADLRSSLTRKNPLGAIEAFRRSGCGERGEAVLLVKVHGLAEAPGGEAVRTAAAQVEGVVLLDARLASDDMDALLSSVDCVLSAHRSEGYGLVLAEAMQRGIPVVATGWSGNMDFMDAKSAALIDYRITPVKDPTGVYASGEWADPDLDHAANRLQTLVSDPALRSAIGLAGKARIEAHCGRDAWFERVAPRLR